QRGARGRGGTGAVALADRVRPVRRCVGRGDVRGHGGGVLVPADGARRGVRAGRGGHDGERGGHAPAARAADVGDAAAAGRRTVLGGAAGGAHGVRAADLRPV